MSYHCDDGERSSEAEAAPSLVSCSNGHPEKYSSGQLVEFLLCPLNISMQYRVAIPTVSLGRAAHHDLELKLDQAARYGFKGIEIFYEDLEQLASSPKYAISSSEEDNLLGAAAAVRASCLEHGMEIICLQPFSHYEGLVDRDEHQQMIHKAMFWLSLAQALGTTIIQIPTSFREDGTTGDRDLIVQDMIELADLGAQETPPIKFAYENLCWGRHLDTWEEVWDVVKRVDRANFGICLDTFNITGRIWADPTAVDGKTPGADETLRLSLEKLKATVDVAKVFYIQVVDAEKMDPALGSDHLFHCRNQPPRMSWSRNARSRLNCFQHRYPKRTHLYLSNTQSVVCSRGNDW